MIFPIARLGWVCKTHPSGCLLQTLPRLAIGNVPGHLNSHSATVGGGEAAFDMDLGVFNESFHDGIRQGK